MNQGKFAFAQVSSFLPQRVFDRIVEVYNGNYRVRHFTCWNQMMCMMFGQLCSRESLSDLVISINAHFTKTYHLGFGKGISKANIAKANEIRDWRIYADFAYYLIDQARGCCSSDIDFQVVFKGPVYAFDSTTIDLCLSIFWWAKFRKQKAAIKLHTLYDIKTSIPCFVHVTNGLTNDVNGMDALDYETGSMYIFDRGYVDYKRLFRIDGHEAFFVVRAKRNIRFNRIYSHKCNKVNGVRCDQTIKLSGFYQTRDYPKKMRRVKFYDTENNRMFVFLTNNFDLKAEDIAMLYKHRWKIELFFKWIKQHLKIKSFWGTSANAVKTQLYIAIITYTLVAIIKSKLKIERSNYEIPQILGVSLMDKSPLNELLKNEYPLNENVVDYKQLSIFES